MRLKRISAGLYETHDGKFRVMRWTVSAAAGRRPSWAISERDEQGWDFVCEVLTLGEARKYLKGETVFILS